MAKNILVIYPTWGDYTYLPQLAESGLYTFVFEDFNLNMIRRLIYTPSDDTIEVSHKELIDNIITQAKGFDALIGTLDYPSCLAAALAAQANNLRSPSVESVLACQHKYYFRHRSRQIVPEATPPCMIIDQKNPTDINASQLPVFVKPIKSSFSKYAKKITTMDELQQHCTEAVFHPDFLQFFNTVFAQYIDFDCDAQLLLAETPLEGIQVSLEGFVFDGYSDIIGIVDAEMHTGTLSFSAFTYPTQLPESVQERMKTITKRIISGLDVDNTLFSVEYMYNPQTDDIFIIEINPRISAQFTDLFQKVDGINSYQILLDIALGNEPSLSSQGSFTHAASFPLRTFSNQRVIRIPTEQEIGAVIAQFPDAIINIRAEEGKLLSDMHQDGSSYSYAIINIGAQSITELKKKRDSIVSQLRFIFESAEEH